MDKLSIVGMLVAVVAILGGQLLEGGALGSLLQTAAFLIVVGGTLGAVMLQSPLPTFILGMRLSRWVIRPPSIDHLAAIKQLGEWAGIARKEGMLALENRLSDARELFTRNGIQMLIDGFEPEKIRAAMDIEIHSFDDRYRTAARVWEAAGGYAPTIGIIGAVLGLIHVMENLTDPSRLGGGIAVAFVATIYGVASANLFFLPIANKLRALIAIQVMHREIIVDGLIGIANGENPKLIVARLNGYLG